MWCGPAPADTHTLALTQTRVRAVAAYEMHEQNVDTQYMFFAEILFIQRTQADRAMHKS